MVLVLLDILDNKRFDPNDKALVDKKEGLTTSSLLENPAPNQATPFPHFPRKRISGWLKK